MSVENTLLGAMGSLRGRAAADRLCVACVDALGVDQAAISLVFEGVNTGTLGASGTVARELDELQFTFGEGPCLAAVAQRSAVFMSDLAISGSELWPLYVPALLEAQVRAVFAVPVMVGGEFVGALDLFCRQPARLVGDELAGAFVAARLAEMPLLDLLAETVPDAAADPGGPAWDELNDLIRVEVNRATGMVVGQLDLEPSAALARIRAHAYATGRSVTDVAKDILEHRLELEP